MERVLQDNLLDFLIGFTLIAVCFLLTYKKKKTGNIIDLPILNKRILEYKPEPLVNDREANLLTRAIIESPMPKDPCCLNLAKINYINLLDNEDLRKKAEECIRTYGVGSCGPRGFYGTIDVHLDLENKIAEFLHLEETVLYSYGFSTISSAIGAYCKKNDYIFCDEEISFAAVQGFVASRSKVIYFKHNDTEDLEKKLEDVSVVEKEKNKRFRKFLVIEGIYMKTGTICPLPKLIDVSKRHKMRIFLNESHSFGVLGKTGRGVTEHFGVDRSEIDMIMGSLETSLGSVGGFCVGRSVVIEHQRLSGLGYCFSASLPPFLSYIPLCAIEILKENPNIFTKLENISIKMHENLETLEDFDIISDPISPLKVISFKKGANTEKADRIYDFCANNGVVVLKMDEKIQFHVNSRMKEEEMKKVVDTLAEAVKFHNIKYLRCTVNYANVNYPIATTTQRSLTESSEFDSREGRGMMMMDYDHEDFHHDETTTPAPKEEQKAVKTDNWANYYDFIINEGSFKFWAAFQLGTAILLIYSAFAAIYYAKFNIISTDYDYYDELFGRSFSGGSPTTPPDSGSNQWFGLSSETIKTIFNAITSKKYS
ncbi:putative aminotransferase class I and II [Trypoxylus dichotomus]